MPESTFTDRLIKAIREKRSLLCVGLDPQFRFIPLSLKRQVAEMYGRGLEGMAQLFVRFNEAIINAVAPYVSAVKPQMAFYEQYGHWGVWAFEETVALAREQGLVVVGDLKRGDGGDTAEAYAAGYLGEVDFWPEGKLEEMRQVSSPVRCDAITIQPQIGSACVLPFVAQVKQHGTGVFLVTKTSFKPNSEVEQLSDHHQRPVWEDMAVLARQWGEGTEGEGGYRNVGVVMGATYPEDAPMMRSILPNAWFLVPGYGAQGGGADCAVVGVNKDGFGAVVNSSRGIIFAFHPVSKSQFQGPGETYIEAAGNAARAARDELNEALKRAGKFNF